MKKTSKKVSQQRHAYRRALQRHGLDLYPSDFEEMVRQIQSGQAEFVERQSNRVTKWVCLHKGKRLPVIYDKNRKVIVTVLEEAWV